MSGPETTDKYSIKDLVKDKPCPDCNSPIILTFTAKGRSFECSKCGKELGDYPYPPSKPPEHMRGRCTNHGRLGCKECLKASK